jgi:hypothetical protein
VSVPQLETQLYAQLRNTSLAKSQDKLIREDGLARFLLIPEPCYPGAVDLKLGDVQREVELRAQKIGAPAVILPTYGRTEDSARPHIEVSDRGYHYVTVERGTELERLTTAELNELLYTVFQSVTFSMACAYEVKHRVAGRDARRLLFHHQVELLGRLDPQWARRCLHEQDRVLQRHPFSDGL